VVALQRQRQVNNQIGVARATLLTTVYQNKFAYSFKKFAMRMKTAFMVLEKHSKPHAETAKVKMLHNCIQVPGNNLIQIAKLQVLDQNGGSFTTAISYMSRKVVEIFPEVFDQDNWQKRNGSEMRIQHARNQACGMGQNHNSNERGGCWCGSMDAAGDVTIVSVDKDQQ
jgi:hypothetical protein